VLLKSLSATPASPAASPRDATLSPVGN
jgi:hypothetical protein